MLFINFDKIRNCCEQLAYTKKPEERNFRAVITLEECILEDGPEESDAEDTKSKSKKSNGSAEDPTANLVFRVSHKVAYKTVLKGQLFLYAYVKHLLSVESSSFLFFFCNVMGLVYSGAAFL